MRILLISYYFPPYNTIGSLRTGKFAKYFHQQGHDVRVVTVKPLSLPDDLVLEIPETQVYPSRHININFLPELVAGGKKDVTVKGYSSGSTIINKLGRLYKEFFNVPDDAVGWIPYGLRKGLAVTKDWKPDLIYASATPYSSLIIAANLSKRLDVPWLAEFRDLWVGNQTRKHTKLRQAIDMVMEKLTLKRACAIVTVSNPLSAALKSRYVQPVHVIENGFDPDDFDQNNHISTSEKDHLLISYTGLMVADYRDPSPLFKAISDLGEEGQNIKVDFYGRYSELVLPLAEKYDLVGQINAYPSVSNRTSLCIQSQSDVLLHLLWNDPSQPGILTGKLYEYLGSRRPILAVGKYHEQDEAAQKIMSRGAGLATNDPATIKHQLIKWLEEKKINGYIQQLPESVHQGLTRADQFRKLEIILQDIVRDQN